MTQHTVQILLIFSYIKLEKKGCNKRSGWVICLENAKEFRKPEPEYAYKRYAYKKPCN